MSKLSEWIEAHLNNPDDELAVRNYTLNTEMYEREFAEAEAKGIIVECSVCGYPENPEHSLNGDEYIKHKLCFGCWFWMIHLGLKNGPRPNSVIVKGVHYVDGGNKPKERSAFLGFGGSKWYYRKIGEAEYVETNNMWHQGTIPKRFNIPDTHEFKPYERKEVTNGSNNSQFKGAD